MWLWEFLYGFGCESFCMGLVVRISVWVWVVGIFMSVVVVGTSV